MASGQGGRPESSIPAAVAAGLLVGGVAIGVLTGRLMFEARKFYIQGEALQQSGENEKAVQAFEDAARA